MVSILGFSSHLFAVLSGQAELCPRQCCATWFGGPASALPVVLGGMVRTGGREAFLSDGHEDSLRACQGHGRLHGGSCGHSVVVGERAFQRLRQSGVQPPHSNKNPQNHEPPSGTETCSCTTIQPLARFSSTIVQRPSRCDAAPCWLTMSAPNVNVAQASLPRECTRKSSFILSLMLRFGSKSAFFTPTRYSAQLLYFIGARSKYVRSASAA